MMDEPRKNLVALYCNPKKLGGIGFRFTHGRWGVFESFRPWDIREALSVSLNKVEEAIPGTVEKAAALDEDNFKGNNRRTRRYIADRRDLLYPGRPDLAEKASEGVAGHWVVTNIRWDNVPDILRLVCRAAEIKYGSLSEISF